MRKITVSDIKQLLHDHYSAPLNKSFKQFRTGAIFFSVGLIIVYLSLTAIPPSAKQEFILLCGLIIGGCGFIIAILAHIRMVIARVIQFFKHN